VIRSGQTESLAKAARETKTCADFRTPVKIGRAENHTVALSAWRICVLNSLQFPENKGKL
jgi:hypothetical protein